MTTLIHCVYASRAATSFREYELPSILDHARLRNETIGITGMLLFIDGCFFQVLEGRPVEVISLFESIRKDSRHLQVTQIIREPIPRRSFADWTMGFANIGRVEAGEITGESGFFTDPVRLDRIGAGRAKKLLNTFRNGDRLSGQTGTFNRAVRSA